MSLVRLSIENYRCFRDKQELELRPITVVLGKNNFGKSALVRSPLVLATGIHNDTSLPLDLDQLGDNAPEFLDLVHNRVEHGSVTVGLEFDLHEPIRIEATVQNIDEWQTQVISRWSISDSNGTTALEWLADDDGGSDERRYKYPGQDSAIVTARFEGLLPPFVLSSPQQADRFRDVREQIRAELDEMRYLGPFRTRPIRTGRLRARPPIQDESGGGTAAILIHDHVRRGGRLIDKVNEYLGHHLPGWALEVVPRHDGYSVGLKSTTIRGLWVPATDSGSGVTQVLPILLGMAQDELAPPGRSVLEIIEEPELHLHPSAQAELAELYIAATRRSGTRFLIETHSETFLLRLRRRVAEKKLDPGMLALYFIEKSGATTRARRINVNELGEVDYWPEGVFSEDFEEVRALAAAQSDQAESHAS